MYHSITRFNIENKTEVLPQLFIVGHETANDQSYRFSSHFKRDYSYSCFQLTLSGEGVFSVNGERHTVGSGKGFLFNTEDEGWEYFYPEGALKPWEFLYVEFQGKNAFMTQRWLVQEFGNIFDLGLNHPMLKKLLHFRKTGINKQAVSSILSAEIINDLLMALANSAKITPEPDFEPVVRRVINLVKQNLSLPLSVTSIAEEMGMSREHLSRVFHQNMGVTLYQFILSEKMEYACHLLKTSKLSIKEVAFLCGYSSSAHFCRLFKKVNTMTPKLFKASCI